MKAGIIKVEKPGIFEFSKDVFQAKHFLPLLIVVIMALVLRINFVTGNVRSDPLNYAHAAYELANGQLHFDTWKEGTSRIGMYFPTALLYKVFGVSEWITLFYPIFSSLLGIIFVYFIGFNLDGERAGLGAALLWSLFPLEIHQATILLPDGPMATFCSGAVLGLIMAMKTHGRRSLWFYAASFASLVWAFLIKPLALVTLIFFIILAIRAVWQERERIYKRIADQKKLVSANMLLYALPLSIILFGLLYFFSNPLYLIIVDLSKTATDASRLFVLGEINLDFSWERVTHTEILFFVTPLFLVAIAILIWEDYKRARFALILLAVYFLYYEWGSVSSNPSVYSPIQNFVDPRNLLFMTVPFFVVTAIYIARRFDSKSARKVFIVCSVLTTLTALSLKPLLLSGSPLPRWFFGILILVILGSFLSPLFLTGRRSILKQQLATAFLIFLTLSFIYPTPPYQVAYWNDFREYMDDLEVLARLIRTAESPVYVPHSAMAIQLSYASNFTLSYEWAEEGNDAQYQIRIGSPPEGTELPLFVVALGEPKSFGFRAELITQFDNNYQDIFLYMLNK